MKKVLAMLARRQAAFIGSGALLLAVLAAFYFTAPKGEAQQEAQASAAPQGPPPAVVRLAEATTAELAPTADAPGSVVSLRDSLVAAETNGKIVWIAEVGAEIAEGEVIARIDPADATFARNESAAEVKRLEARASYLDSLYERYQGLGEDGGESAATLDEMRANRDEARQNLARARAAFERAQTNLARTDVKAPFTGRVVGQEIQIGEFATPGRAVARLVDTRHLEVTAQAPATVLHNVRVGDEIALGAGAQTLKGAVRAIVPVGDEISRTLEIRLALPEDAGWHIGSAVRVNLPTTGKRSVVAGHRDALVLRANRVSVFVVGDDMTARQIDVEIGAADGDLIEIIGDVKPGDRLVVRGGERLRDGQTVVLSDIPVVADAS